MLGSGRMHVKHMVFVSMRTEHDSEYSPTTKPAATVCMRLGGGGCTDLGHVAYGGAAWQLACVKQEVMRCGVCGAFEGSLAAPQPSAY
jgi:hypothetical protein